MLPTVNSLGKIFVLRPSKIAANQKEYSRLEESSVNQFLVAKKCKPCDIYRRMCDVDRETGFSQKSLQMG